MSMTLKLTRTGDSDLSLNTASGSNGIHIEWQNFTGYVPGIAEPGQYVTDTLRAYVNAASADTLATTLQSLSNYQRRAVEYSRDPTQYKPVWLEAQTNNESGARRAHVRRLRWRFINPPGDWDVGTDAKTTVEIAVERGIWERTEDRTMSASVTAGACSAIDPTDSYDPAGDDPARIPIVAYRFTGDTTERAWIGLRSADKHNALADFEPIWECEDGTNTAIASDDTTTETNLASPGGGSGAYVDITASADDTWEEAFTLRLDDVVATSTKWDSNTGLFLWLLRAKVTAGTYQVQFRFGYPNVADADLYRLRPFEVTATSWNWHAGGTPVDIPFGILNPLADNYSSLVTTIGSWSIEVWVKRTSGSGDLYCDCLVPLPTDEGYLIATDMGVPTGQYFYFVEGPTGEVRAFTYSSGSFVHSPVVDAQNFRLPTGDSRMYVVFARDAQTVLTDTVDMPNENARGYYERWRSLRGGE